MTASRLGALGRTSRTQSRFWPRTILLAACAVAFFLFAWDTFAAPRFNGAIGWTPGSTEHGLIAVTYVKPGWPADRAGLRVGDWIAQRGASPGHWIAGKSYPTPVVRNGNHLIITLTPIATPITPTFWLTAVLDLWLVAFATIIALRGTDLQTRLLSWILLLFALSDVLQNGAGRGFVSPWPWLNELVNIVAFPLTLSSFALTAFLASSFAQPASVTRRILEILTYAATATVVFLTMLGGLSSLVPWFDTWTWFYNSPAYSLTGAAASFLVAACAGAAVGAASGNERQRATWVLVPLAIVSVVGGVGWILGQFAGGYWNGHADALDRTMQILNFLVPLVLTYAVVKRRLLDVNFVVNRAAVFSVVSVVVIGAFVLTEWLFNQVFAQASHTTSILVSAGVALVLGVLLTYIHRHVDKFVDRIFFWKRHEHEQALRAFAQESEFITDYDTLLDNTLSEVSTHAEADRVSILVRDEDGAYTTARRTDGDLERVDENDRAILKMRARHKAIDLDDVETALGGAWAYPLMSRGELLGILVCGTKRSGESYAPDENEALAALAQSVGTALASLRPEREDLREVIYEVRAALRALVRADAVSTP